MPRAGLSADRLAEAAVAMADEAGFENVTLSALARHFGVRDASLYSHVSGLRELRTRMALLAGGELVERIARQVGGRSGREALGAYADAYRAYALEHPGRYAATQIRIDPSVAASSPVMARTAEVTYGLLRTYGLAEPDLTDAVRLLRSTFHGFCALEAGGGFGAPRETRLSWERLVDALHVALENWPVRGGPVL